MIYLVYYRILSLYFYNDNGIIVLTSLVYFFVNNMIILKSTCRIDRANMSNFRQACLIKKNPVKSRKRVKMDMMSEAGSPSGIAINRTYYTRESCNEEQHNRIVFAFIALNIFDGGVVTNSSRRARRYFLNIFMCTCLNSNQNLGVL